MYSTRRDKVVLATKVYQPMKTGPNGRACEASLKRLETDHIDLRCTISTGRRLENEIRQAMKQLIH